MISRNWSSVTLAAVIVKNAMHWASSAILPTDAWRLVSIGYGLHGYALGVSLTLEQKAMDRKPWWIYLVEAESSWQLWSGVHVMTQEYREDLILR
jgi:hypothetical protein